MRGDAVEGKLPGRNVTNKKTRINEWRSEELNRGEEVDGGNKSQY